MTERDETPAGVPDTLELAEDLRRAIGRFVRSVRTAAETPSSAQSETLGLLDRDGPMSVARMAEARGVKHQSMRLVVAQLEEDGTVARLPDPADGRSQLVSLTPEGRAALAQSRIARTGWIADAIGKRLSDEERRTLKLSIALLDRLAETDPTDRR